MPRRDGEDYKDKINVFHYNDKTSMYKALAINPTDDNDSIFIAIRQGMKGEKANSLALKLDMKEIAYLIMELKKLYNDLE